MPESTPKQSRDNVSSKLSPRIDPYILLEQIDKTVDGLKESLPNLLQKLSNPDARERAKEIEHASLSAILARRKLLDALLASIDIYASKHAETSKYHVQGRISKTFMQLREEIFRANEVSIVRFYESYSSFVDSIHALVGLTESEKEKLILAAYRRTEEAEKRAFEVLPSILDLIAEQVREMIKEVGTM